MECAIDIEPPEVFDECEDMRQWYETFVEPRYYRGRSEYGRASVQASPLRNVLAAAEELADGLFYLRQALNKLLPRDGRLRVYIAGPYRGKTHEEQEQYIRVARDAAIEVLRAGHSPFCPHTMTAFFDETAPDIPREIYLQTDLDWLQQCHAILLLPGWEQSLGAQAELEEAKRLCLPHFREVANLPTPEEVQVMAVDNAWDLLN